MNKDCLSVAGAETNTATVGIAQLFPLMPGSVFTIVDSVYTAS